MRLWRTAALLKFGANTPETALKRPSRPRFFPIFGIYADLTPEIGEKPHKKSIACCISRPVILKCRAAYPYVMHTG
jgi:hypothetical protein